MRQGRDGGKRSRNTAYMKVHVITGDRHETERSFRELRSKFFGDSPQNVIEVEDCARAHAELMCGSLFVSKALVHIRSSLIDPEWIAQIIKWAPHLSPREDRLLVVRDVGSSLDRRKISKLKRNDDVVLLHFDELKKPRDAVQFAVSYMKEKRYSADAGAIELLVRIVGNDRGLIVSEIDKLMSVANRLTMKYVTACAFPSGAEGTHIELYMALGEGNEIIARKQVAELMADGIPPLAILGSIMKILSVTMAGPEQYGVEQNKLNESWMGSEKPKKVTTFMRNIYVKIFERMGRERILNVMTTYGASLAAIRLSLNGDIEKTRVDQLIGEICRE